MGSAERSRRIAHAGRQDIGCNRFTMERRASRSSAPARLWVTFLRNHREAIAAMDFFAIPTLTFGVRYCLFVISHEAARRLTRRYPVHTSMRLAASVRGRRRQHRDLGRAWSGWGRSLILVTPESVVRWHRAGGNTLDESLTQPKRGPFGFCRVRALASRGFLL